MRVAEATRRADPVLTHRKRSFRAKCQRARNVAEILDRQRVYESREVRRAAARGKNGPADGEIPYSRVECRKPFQDALPGHPARTELDWLTIGLKYQAQEWSRRAVLEVRTARELDRAAVRLGKEPDGVNGAVGWMDAWERKPVVSGYLPGNRWWLAQLLPHLALVDTGLTGMLTSPRHANNDFTQSTCPDA